MTCLHSSLRFSLLPLYAGIVTATPLYMQRPHVELGERQDIIDNDHGGDDDVCMRGEHRGRGALHESLCMAHGVYFVWQEPVSPHFTGMCNVHMFNFYFKGIMWEIRVHLDGVAVTLAWVRIANRDSIVSVPVSDTSVM